eukprot:768486-Hanusia_phi.AAC.5
MQELDSTSPATIPATQRDHGRRSCGSKHHSCYKDRASCMVPGIRNMVASSFSPRFKDPQNVFISAPSHNSCKVNQKFLIRGESECSSWKGEEQPRGYSIISAHAVLI